MTLRSSPPHLTAATDLHPPAVPERRAVAAVWWTGDALTIIDQRRLPEELVDWRLTSVADVKDAIATLAVRGAPAIGIAGAYGLVIGLDEAHRPRGMRRSPARPTRRRDRRCPADGGQPGGRSRCDGARRASLDRWAG